MSKKEKHSSTPRDVSAPAAVSKRKKDSTRRGGAFPRSLGETLKPITQHAFKKHGFAESRLLTDWHSVAGPALARSTLPLRITFPKGRSHGGTLTLQVATGFAVMVQHQEPMILDRLAAHFGFRAVSGLRLVQAPMPVASAPPPVRRRAEAVTGETLAQLSSITDPELHAALLSLGAALSAK